MTDTAALRSLGIVEVHPDVNALADSAAQLVSDACREAVVDHGAFFIALAGGNTPKLLYQRLATAPWSERMQWDAWRVYFGDERAVSPDDEQSNYRLAATELLSKVPVADEHVHRMLGEAPDLDAAAAAYHRVLEDTLPVNESGVPVFDLVLLGLGENGHTASLFPGTPALEVQNRWATRGRADYAPFDRLTLTYPVLNAARTVVFTVAGAGKHAALHHTAGGTTPAAGVQPRSGPARWLLDTAASTGAPAAR
jgi:6-phosphogluconolactonase